MEYSQKNVKTSFFVNDYAKRIYKTMIFFLITFVLVFTSLNFIKPAYAENDDDYTFYNIAHTASSYFDQVNNLDAKVDGIDEEERTFKEYPNNQIDMANAGAYAGYVDDERVNGPIGYLISSMTGSEQTRAYNAYPMDDPNHSLAGVREYLEYGHALQTLGFDTVLDGFVGKLGRGFGGALLYIGFLIASFADLSIKFAVKVLQFFNPFAWFRDTMLETIDYNNAFSGVVEVVSTWYGKVQSFGLFVAFVLFTIAFVFFILGNKRISEINGPFKKFIARTAFMVAFVPIVGGLYTSGLDALDSSLANGYGSTSAIKSLLVDFTNWSQNQNLALPRGTNITVNRLASRIGAKSGAGNVGISKNPRLAALDINRFALVGIEYQPVPDEDYSLKKIDNMTSYIDEFSKTSKLIYDFMSSQEYQPSTYESDKKGNWSDDKKYAKGLKEAGDYKFYSDDKERFENNDAPKESKIPFLVNGSMDVEGSESQIKYIGKNGGGLSDISMYTYLSTNFLDSEVKVSSPVRQVSKKVTTPHAAVSMVGQGGISKFINYMMTLSMLLVTGLIGLVYGLGLIANSIGKGVRIVVSMFPAFMGSFRGMSKMAMIAVSMIVEIYITLVAYTIAQSLFLAFNVIMVDPLTTIVGDMVNGSSIILSTSATNLVFSANIPNFWTTTAFGQILSIIFGMIATLANFYIGIKLLKLRSVLVKGLEEILSGIIDNLFGKVSETDINGAKEEAGERGMGSKIGAGIAGAGGMYAAGKARDKLNKNKEEGKQDGDIENIAKSDKDSDAKEKDPSKLPLPGSGDQIKKLKSGKDDKKKDGLIDKVNDKAKDVAGMDHKMTDAQKTVAGRYADYQLGLEPGTSKELADKYEEGANKILGKDGEEKEDENSLPEEAIIAAGEEVSNPEKDIEGGKDLMDKDLSSEDIGEQLLNGDGNTIEDAEIPTESGVDEVAGVVSGDDESGIGEEESDNSQDIEDANIPTEFGDITNEGSDDDIITVNSDNNETSDIATIDTDEDDLVKKAQDRAKISTDDKNNESNTNNKTKGDLENARAKNRQAKENLAKVSKDDSQKDLSDDELKSTINKSKAYRLSQSVGDSFNPDIDKEKGDMFGIASISDPRLRDYGKKIQDGNTDKKQADDFVPQNDSSQNVPFRQTIGDNNPTGQNSNINGYKGQNIDNLGQNTNNLNNQFMNNPLGQNVNNVPYNRNKHSIDNLGYDIPINRIGGQVMGDMRYDNLTNEGNFKNNRNRGFSTNIKRMPEKVRQKAKSINGLTDAELNEFYNLQEENRRLEAQRGALRRANRRNRKGLNKNISKQMKELMDTTQLNKEYMDRLSLKTGKTRKELIQIMSKKD